MSSIWGTCHGVNLIECEIEKIDQGRESIELMLSILVDIHKIDESTPKHEDIAKFKKTIQELYELREKKLEELRGAKQSLEKAKALPE